MSDERVLLAGHPVHRIGFGAMQLPGPGVFGPPKDHEAALAVLRRAVELGIDHIDTAEYYGPKVSNELIREALAPYPADLALVSKVGGARDEKANWIPAAEPDQLRAGIEDNLRTLGVDKLAAVNLRRMPGPAGEPDLDAQLDAMIAARDDGLIDGIGLSEVDAGQLRHALDRTEIACVQNAYNLLHRDDEPVLELCAERGIPYVPYFPLGSAFPGMPKVTEHPVVRAQAERLGVTAGQIGLAWLLQHAPNLLLICGTSSVAHLEENVAAGDVRLDEEAVAALDALG